MYCTMVYKHIDYFYQLPQGTHFYKKFRDIELFMKKIICNRLDTIITFRRIQKVKKYMIIFVYFQFTKTDMTVH